MLEQMVIEVYIRTNNEFASATTTRKSRQAIVSEKF